MRKYELYLFPIFLIIVGLFSLSGFEYWGAALFEAAPWKQNALFCLLLIFGMLPPAVREMRFTWLTVGGAFVLILKGAANAPGSVGLILFYTKILFTLLAIFMTYRIWKNGWKVNKLYMIPAVCLLISVALLIPIKDQNIVGSAMSAIKSLSTDRFFSDKGFHIYLGLVGIFSGITELLILKSSLQTNSKELEINDNPQ